MMDYFQTVVSDLTIEDLTVLGILHDNEATSNFKSLKYQKVIDLSNLTKAKFYKTIHRLTANKLIETIAGREYQMYITNFGILALEKSLNKEE